MAADRWSSGPGFLLSTVGAAVGLGVPMLVLELAVGRTLRSDVVSAFRSVDTDYAALGWLVVGGVLLVLSYYLVLTGWVFGFLLSWLGGTGTTFATFTAGWLPVGYFVLATVPTGVVVARGVRGGIERLSNVVMPTVFALLLALGVYAVTLPGWERALEFLFTPTSPSSPIPASGARPSDRCSSRSPPGRASC
jgi:NSS family neurotransmitter:Na+ symporter